jgi:hypothetical protein
MAWLLWPNFCTTAEIVSEISGNLNQYGAQYSKDRIWKKRCIIFHTCYCDMKDKMKESRNPLLV